MQKRALGMIETKGLVGSIEAADAMVAAVTEAVSDVETSADGNSTAMVDTAVAAMPETSTSTDVQTSTAADNESSTSTAVAPVTSLENVTVIITNDMTALTQSEG